MSVKILVVDDNATFRTQLKTYLENQFFRVETAFDGNHALSLLDSFEPDLIILDVHMPQRDGLDVCRAIRARPGYAEGQKGIIMISGERMEVLDQVAGLEIGADKYLTKPVVPRFLLAQIKALLRLVGGVPTSATSLQVDDRVRINFAERLVEVNGQPVRLSKLEFDVLEYLAKPPNTARSRTDLGEAVWKWKEINDGAINRVMASLRKKIEANTSKPIYIESVFGVGYKLVIKD